MSSFFLASTVETQILSCRDLISDSFLEDSSWEKRRHVNRIWMHLLEICYKYVIRHHSHHGCCRFLWVGGARPLEVHDVSPTERPGSPTAWCWPLPKPVGRTHSYPKLSPPGFDEMSSLSNYRWSHSALPEASTGCYLHLAKGQLFSSSPAFCLLFQSSPVLYALAHSTPTSQNITHFKKSFICVNLAIFGHCDCCFGGQYLFHITPK